ncbi:MAG: LytTR family DNA-binding domain-containing protein [Bacteroidia bacterium]
MIRSILVDDEQHCRESLSATLNHNFPEVELLAQCTSIYDGENAIELYKPDLVFLDVELPPYTGFDMLKKIGTISFETIFTTAYDKYAIRAIKASALDFLLKPVDKEELGEALEHFKQKHSKSNSQEKMEVLFENVRQMRDPLRKLMIPTQDGFDLVSVSDIVRLQSDNNYTNFHFADKRKILVSKTLKDFDDMLSGHSFFRVHQSHIINLHYVKNYLKGEGGVVMMQEGTEIDVSRRRKEEFIKSLESL